MTDAIVSAIHDTLNDRIAMGEAIAHYADRAHRMIVRWERTDRPSARHAYTLAVADGFRIVAARADLDRRIVAMHDALIRRVGPDADHPDRVSDAPPTEREASRVRTIRQAYVRAHRAGDPSLALPEAMLTPEEAMLPVDGRMPEFHPQWPLTREAWDVRVTDHYVTPESDYFRP